MHRRRSSLAKSIFSYFIMIALYISLLISVKNYTRIFVALWALAWHVLANLYCSYIASYRFENPAAKYIQIKNKWLRKIFVRQGAVGGINFTSQSDQRTNVIGLVLNIANVFLFLLFEILLLIPQIPCDPYVFTVAIGTRPHNYSHFYLEFHSFNEIISAEGSMIFSVAMALVLMAFVLIFDRRVKEHRRKIQGEKSRKPRSQPLVKTEWYSQLYKSLVDMTVRRNSKKLKFWYDTAQLGHIENLVREASENAELKIQSQGDRPISFVVMDTLNNHVVFRGLFT